MTRKISYTAPFFTADKHLAMPMASRSTIKKQTLIQTDIDISQKQKANPQDEWLDNTSMASYKSMLLKENIYTT